MRSRVQLLLTCFALVGCLSTVPEVQLDNGPDDGGGLEAGTPDASAGDAGGHDAGVPDAGVPDAGAPRCSATNPCAAIGYKFEQSPDCGTFCYYDEPHNIAVNGAGQEQNPANFNQYALGQLVDGVRGNPDWTVNGGNGPGYAWVGWLYRDATVVFQFAETREFSAVTVGLNNHGTGAVYAPSEIGVELGDDGVTFGAPWTFRRADSTLPPVAIGTRGDVRLPVPGATGKFVRVTVVYSAAWSMVDEFGFE
ncbi:MAG: hypothetical protein Q8L48_02985 [Archangium sp.]|nr:hypothetical protein [Archangium sp.]